MRTLAYGERREFEWDFSPAVAPVSIPRPRTPLSHGPQPADRNFRGSREVLSTADFSVSGRPVGSRIGKPISQRETEMTARVKPETGKNARIMTRELLDCFRRDIDSGHPVFSNRAIQILKECIECEGNFDCEATRLSALNLFASVTARG